MTLRKLLAVTPDMKIARQIVDLAGGSHHVVHVRSGESVEQALRADPLIAVLLVDHAPNVPAADAVRLLERAQEHRPDVRRGLVTGYADVGAIIRALHVGAVQFAVQRPIVPAELIAALASRAVVAAAEGRAGYTAA